RKELSGLTVGDLHLPSPGQTHTGFPAAGAYIELSGADAKSGKAAMLPLRDDVLAELKAVLMARGRLQRRASMAMAAKGTRGWSIPPGPDAPGVVEASVDDLPLDMKLFSYPPTIRVFDADCQAAGIPKTDRRGRVVDIHALRHTFGTHLSAAGVHPRVAMAAMRHSRIELTMNLYTDPVLLDVAGAVQSLPAFAIAEHSESRRPQARLA
ncbi:MAG: site-specific integrase, partial [bacterium]